MKVSHDIFNVVICIGQVDGEIQTIELPDTLIKQWWDVKPEFRLFVEDFQAKHPLAKSIKQLKGTKVKGALATTKTPKRKLAEDFSKYIVSVGDEPGQTTVAEVSLVNVRLGGGARGLPMLVITEAGPMVKNQCGKTVTQWNKHCLFVYFLSLLSFPKNVFEFDALTAKHDVLYIVYTDYLSFCLLLLDICIYDIVITCYNMYFYHKSLPWLQVTLPAGLVFAGWGKGKFREVTAEKPVNPDNELEFNPDPNTLAILDGKFATIGELLELAKTSKPELKRALNYYTSKQEPDGEWKLTQDYWLQTCLMLKRNVKNVPKFQDKINKLFTHVMECSSYDSLSGASPCLHHWGRGPRSEMDAKPSCKEAHPAVALEHRSHLSWVANEVVSEWHDTPTTRGDYIISDWLRSWEGFCTQEQYCLIHFMAAYGYVTPLGLLVLASHCKKWFMGSWIHFMIA